MVFALRTVQKVHSVDHRGPNMLVVVGCFVLFFIRIPHAFYIDFPSLSGPLRRSSKVRLVESYKTRDLETRLAAGV